MKSKATAGPPPAAPAAEGMPNLTRLAGSARKPIPPSVLLALVIAFTGSLAFVPGCGPPEPQPPPSGHGSAIRIEALNPSGSVTLPFSFEWRTSGPDAPPPAAAEPDPIYRVSVFDPAERLLHAWDTRATRAEPPPDLARYFRSGESFLWKVAVLDGEGKPAVESELARFTIE